MEYKEAILTRAAWLRFLELNQDLIVTGWEFVESPVVTIKDEVQFPYDSRTFYSIVYDGHYFFIDEDDIESMISSEV